MHPIGSISLQNPNNTGRMINLLQLLCLGQRQKSNVFLRQQFYYMASNNNSHEYFFLTFLLDSYFCNCYKARFFALQKQSKGYRRGGGQCGKQ